MFHFNTKENEMVIKSTNPIEARDAAYDELAAAAIDASKASQRLNKARKDYRKTVASAYVYAARHGVHLAPYPRPPASLL